MRPAPRKLGSRGANALLCLAAGALLAGLLPAAAAAAPPPRTPPATATLLADGSAQAPPGAPREVRKAINAANRIRTKPYRYGGGHRRWKDKGYDCSGAVSYVLRATGTLKSPLASGGLARHWGKKGLGRWITVYAHKRHAFVVIAGLRWDTSRATDPIDQGRGPRWRSTHRDTSKFKARRAPRL